MDLALNTRSQGAWAVVEVSGELDLSNSPELGGLLNERIADDDPRVAVDMSGVTFMDSSALGVLVNCLKRARARDGRLVLVGVSGPPLRVLEITGLDEAFTVVATADDLPAA